MPILKKIILSFLLFAAVLSGAFLAGKFMVTSAQEQVLDKAISSFSNEEIQMRFMSFATTLAPLRRLELAKINQLEVFERSSQPKLFWEKLNLPEVVVQASVPVEYLYYVELNEGWRITLNEHVCTVTAPALQAGTPAPDISSLRFEVRKGSIFRDESIVTKELQREMTGLLEKRAQESLTLTKEPARKQIAELAKQWLMSESKQAQVIVVFADELATAP